MTTGASTNCPKSEINFCNQTTSHAAIAAPLYSTSVLNNVTVGCFLLLQLTAPLVDLLSETLPTQSASVYPCTYN